jgi:hypothetical protein
MTAQPGFDVFERQRCVEQRVVLQVDLPDRQIIRGAPIGIALSVISAFSVPADGSMRLI